MVKATRENRMAQEKARAAALRLGRITWATAAAASVAFTPRAPLLSARRGGLPPPPRYATLCDGGGYLRRRTTPGAEAFAGLFAGEEHPRYSYPFLFPACFAKPSSQTLT